MYHFAWRKNKFKNYSNGGGAVKSFVLAFVAIIIALAAFAASMLLTVHTDFAFADAQPHGNTRTYKAGVFNFEGYHMMDEQGYTGYGIEFLNLASEYSRINFEYVGYDKTWNEMQTMLENREIDVVTSARRNADREAKFAFSQSIGRNRTILSIPYDNPKKFNRGNYQSYDGMVIGQIAGSSQNDSLPGFAENKFTYTVKEYADNQSIAEALQNKEIDAILSSNLRKTENEITLEIIEEADFYAMVRKDDTELLDEINYAIEQMNINEGDWQNVLYYKYYGPVYSSALSFTEREKEYIGQVVAGDKKITVTALGDRAPYSYVENGELKGIIPDYFAKVMELAGLKYELVAPVDHEDYHKLRNEVSVVIDNFSNGDYVAGQTHGFNTDSYMTASMTRVRRKGDNSEIKVLALCESQGIDLFPAEQISHYTVKTYPTGDDAMRAVINGEADSAYVYAYTAQVFINYDSTDALTYTIMNGLSTTFSMRVNGNVDHELVTILNKCIKQVPNDTLNALATDYTSFTIGNMNFWQYLESHPLIIVIVVLIIAAILTVILTLYLRGRWNKKLLQNTEQSNKKMSEQLAIVAALSRDYANVYSVNEDTCKARVIKLEGYVTDGIKKDAKSTDEYDYTTVVNKYIQSRVHPEDREELTQALSLDNVKDQLREHNELMGSYRILDEDGNVRHFQYAYLKLKEENEAHDTFILVGFRNIDDMIRKEQQQKVALAEALAEAQYANKAKTTFLNNMSHDIRTPMNAIIGFTSLAATHIDDKEKIKDYLGKILTSGNHLLSLINDVLDMSRIESGKVKIEEKKNSLPEIIHDLKTIVQADVKAKQLEFFIDTLDVTNETIVCDKLRLNQVLLNILSNAMKYTKPGGMVSFRVIQTTAATSGYATYEFRIKDTGIGMSEEFLKHVFEPFEREQTSTVSGIQGTGLGLAITKNIVDMMGGTITVESELGKGSEFTVAFKFRISDGEATPQRLEQLENLRALVVDDDVNTCMSVSKMLSTIGMRPDWTTLGNEAFIRTKFALEQNDPYNAYIIDWLMPDMNGIELVRRIRKVIGDLTPVIILTAYDWTDIEKEAREAGVTAFCSKPLFLSELRNILAAPYMEKKEEEVPTPPEHRFDGKKILLVEDNELNQEIAQTILETAGFIIDTADDGSIAVEMMKKKPAGTYDLILMDVQMPIMNGYEATRAIRALKSKKKANIPIVAMTANAFDEDRKEAMDAGMNGYAAKPIDIDQLMKTLEEVLK